MAAVAVSHLLTGERSIFREQVPTKAQSGAHRGEYDRETLERILVRDAMVPREAVITLSPSDEPAKVIELTATTGHSGFPVVEVNRLAGIITNRDTRNIRTEEGAYPSVRQVMTPAPFVVNPEDTLEDAIAIMVGHGINHLPVVAKEAPDQLAGFLTRADILKAYARASHSAACRKPE
jgi:CIC family chloride channel protein